MNGTASVTVNAVRIGAQTYYVVAGHTAPGGDGSQGNPFYSIQQGINAAKLVDPQGGYHTIVVAAGTYNIGQEESRIADSDGNAWTYSMLDMPNAAYLNNLRIVGAGVDQTIVDAEKANSDTRVLCVDSPGARISGMTLKGGKLYNDGWNGTVGSGVCIGSHGVNVRMANVKIRKTAT